MTDSSLVTSWAVCGIAAAAARFVPVPLLDDVVRQQATRLAVLRTLRAHDRDAAADQVRPLWGEREEQSSRLRRRLRSLSTRLLLFPVRKYAAVFGAVRGVPTDLLRVVLLARTVDRALERGRLADGPALEGEARALRRAADETIDGMDLRLLTSALADGLSQTRGLTSAALALARRRFTQPGADVGLTPEARVAEGAERVTQVLRRPEITQLLDRFDAEVDVRVAGRG